MSLSWARASRICAHSSPSATLPLRPQLHVMSTRAHSGEMSVTGLVKTVNFAFFSDNKKEYPGWYQTLMSTVKGTNLDRRYTKGMNYRRYGLRFEDLLIETPDVREALFRLPKGVLAARDDRIKRALVLNTGGDELPKAAWTREEDDLPYLAPYLSLSVQERRDREAFNPY